jgi:hypothetical protein
MRSMIVTGGIVGSVDSGSLKIFSGAAPATADAASSGDLLADISIAFISWVTATNGTAALNGTASGEALQDGTAGYGRLVSNGGDYCIQGYAGTAATCDFVINAGTFGSASTVTLIAATIIQPSE